MLGLITEAKKGLDVVFAKMSSPVPFPFIVCFLATGWLASTLQVPFALTVIFGFDFFF